MRPVILTFVGAYLPGYKAGGPIRSIANLVEHLGDEFDFKIVTLDREPGDPQPYPDIEVNRWNRVGKAQVYYMAGRPSFAAVRTFINETDHDILYLNSFFSSFTVFALALRRAGAVCRRAAVLAPRGEFSQGAQTLKRWKKALYIWGAQRLGFWRSVTWQASTEAEKDDIRRVVNVPPSDIYVAPDLAVPLCAGDGAVDGVAKPQGRCRLLFLSRIHPMKNLDWALRVLQLVGVPVELSIYGPVEDREYWDHCRKVIQTLPSHVTVTFGGELPHKDVARVAASHDLFFLPTLGENYGHAILEALSVGTPVLISDRTPWRNLEAFGVGWDLPLTALRPFAERIIDVYRMDAETYALMRRRAREYALRHLDRPEHIEANRRMFLSVLRSKSREARHKSTVYGGVTNDVS